MLATGVRRTQFCAAIGMHARAQLHPFCQRVIGGYSRRFTIAAPEAKTMGVGSRRAKRQQQKAESQPETLGSALATTNPQAVRELREQALRLYAELTRGLADLELQNEDFAMNMDRVVHAFAIDLGAALGRYSFVDLSEAASRSFLRGSVSFESASGVMVQLSGFFGMVGG
jgi:hypothetical protein